MEPLRSVMADLRELTRRAGISETDRAVFSMASYDETGSADAHGPWHLWRGSLLFGPEGMTDASWVDWSDSQSPRPRGRVMGSGPAWAAFDIRENGWRLTRLSTASGEALELLAAWYATGELLAPAVDRVRASLESAQSMLTTFAHEGLLARSRRSGVWSLAAMAERPVTGWVHSFVADPRTPLHDDWDVAALGPVDDAPLRLTGLVTGAQSAMTTGGLILVGRVGQSAWIVSIRGTPPDCRAVEVTVGLDPGRISLWELLIELEETDEQGNLVGSRRVRLADLELPTHGGDRAVVSIPSMGRRLTRNLRPHALDGRVLDGADGVVFVEQIDLSVAVRGQTTTAIDRVRIGDATSPSLVERLDAMRTADEAFRRLLEEGAVERVVSEPGLGRKRVRARVAAARGELLVFDMYFGADPEDWSVLADVTVPVRVLTGARRCVLPPGVAPRSPRVRVAQAPGKRFHDRAYVWDGGGVSVGASANGLDESPLFIIDVLEPHVAHELSARFETWWRESYFEQWRL